MQYIMNETENKYMRICQDLAAVAYLHHNIQGAYYTYEWQEERKQIDIQPLPRTFSHKHRRESPSKHLVITRHLCQIEMTLLPYHVSSHPIHTLSSSIHRQAPKFVIKICEIHLTECRLHLGCGEGERIFGLIRNRWGKIVVGYNKRAQGLTRTGRKVEW